MINLPEIIRIQNYSESSKINLSTKKFNKIYDYFSVRIPRNYIENIIKPIKDERFLFFIKYGILRRYEGDCDIIYVEIPQIPKKLVIYRRPHCRMKSLNKLILSRKDLPHIPLFEGEDNLKYLSLELNQITKIEKLISLNNLIFLNLYGNYITEIENLSNVCKLRVLLLGKNQIEKIKNLNFLSELEILDLHSNKIRLIENISQLKKLRILNLANNQISSISELIYNRNLEELNVRKNFLEIIPNMNDFQMLKKINIGKNCIKKLEYILEFSKLKNLKELIIENNPILSNPDIIIHIKNLPIKGKKTSFSNKTPIPNIKLGSENFSYESISSLGTNTISRNINNLNSYTNKSSSISPFPNKNQNFFANNLKKKIFSRKEIINNTIYNRELIYAIDSKQISYNNKNILEMNMVTPSIRRIDKLKINNNMTTTSSEFYSKIIPIRHLWTYEMNNIIIKGFNGYNHKKYKEINIDKGHVEVEGDYCLYLYGNCLKILTEKEYYENIKTISFSYFCYDFIMSKKIIEYIKEFKNLISLKFSNNNIYSFYQLTKLECFENLKNLSIIDNEICNAQILKYFILYRLNTLKYLNNQEIKKSEINISNNIFKFFDKIISIKEQEIYNINNKKEEEKKNNNIIKIDNNKINIKGNKDKIIGYNNINNKKNDEKENYLNEENKYKFFDYIKYNLSIAIEDIIKDEDDNNNII